MSQFNFDMDDLSSDSMSDNLSVLSRTPSPPREFGGLPTPPLSDHSSTGSPSPQFDASMTDSDGPPPAKRRRLSPSMPRETTRLDLHDNDIQLQQGQIDHLVKALRTKRKIVVVAGAGISVSAGSELLSLGRVYSFQDTLETCPSY
jgi:NAD-dependent histone deacetylase SIR2